MIIKKEKEKKVRSKEKSDAKFFQVVCIAVAATSNELTRRALVIPISSNTERERLFGGALNHTSRQAPLQKIDRASANPIAEVARSTPETPKAH